MASFIARRTASSLRLGAVAPAHTICSRRAIHFTPIVQKKKSKAAMEDLFDEEPEEELFKSKPAKTPAAEKATPAASTSALDKSSVVDGETAAEAAARANKSRKLSKTARTERFNQIVDFVTPRLGRKPAVKTPEVRKSAWVNLIGLAQTEEQLTQVAEMFPGWKASGHELDAHVSELFVRRCEELSCPLLALKVYGSFSKYNLTLTLPGAQQLLHSLHVEHSIETVITASALYRVYSLPPIAQDLVSCAMIVSACFKHNTKDSLSVANALTPHLERMLKTQEPLAVSTDHMLKALDKPKVWLKWSLKKVDIALLKTTGARAEWLSQWRAASGHIAEPSQV